MKTVRKGLNVLKEGLRGLWTHRSMGLTSIVSIMAVLVILGFIIITALTMNSIVTDIAGKVDEIEIFVDLDAKDEMKDKLKEQLEEIDGVASVRYKSNDEALDDMKKVFREDAFLLEGRQDALPSSFIVKLDDIGKSQELVDTAYQLEGVHSIVYYQDVINKVMRISNYVRYGGIVVVGALLLIAVFLISNTIKLTVVARKREIGICKYIGASNGLISGPFIIQGLFLGLIAAGLAFLVVLVGYRHLFNRFNQVLFTLITSYMVKPAWIMKDIGIIFATLGAGIGMLGSMFSIRKYLRV